MHSFFMIVRIDVLAGIGSSRCLGFAAFENGLGETVAVVEHYLFHILFGFIYLYLHFNIVCYFFVHDEIDMLEEYTSEFMDKVVFSSFFCGVGVFYYRYVLVRPDNHSVVGLFDC